MSGNVVNFPASTTLTPEQALHSALLLAGNGHLTDLVVVALDQDGDLMVRSSRMDCKTAWWIAERLRKYVLDHVDGP